MIILEKPTSYTIPKLAPVNRNSCDLYGPQKIAVFFEQREKWSLKFEPETLSFLEMMWCGDRYPRHKTYLFLMISTRETGTDGNVQCMAHKPKLSTLKENKGDFHYGKNTLLPSNNIDFKLKPMTQSQYLPNNNTTKHWTKVSESVLVENE